MRDEQRRPVNCPFYGCHVIPRIRGDGAGKEHDLLFIRSHGNQCGLVFGCLAPCARQAAGQAIEWDECPLVHEHVIDLGRR